MNFKSQLLDAVASVANNDSDLIRRDVLIRRLGIGYVLCTEGERLKKSAKTSLSLSGIIPSSFTPGATLDLSDAKGKFTLLAVTSQPARRLSETALRVALQNEGLTSTKIARIINAAYQDCSPATTYKVEQR